MFATALKSAIQTASCGSIRFSTAAEKSAKKQAKADAKARTNKLNKLNKALLERDIKVDISTCVFNIAETAPLNPIKKPIVFEPVFDNEFDSIKTEPRFYTFDHFAAYHHLDRSISVYSEVHDFPAEQDNTPAAPEVERAPFVGIDDFLAQFGVTSGQDSRIESVAGDESPITGATTPVLEEFEDDSKSSIYSHHNNVSAISWDSTPVEDIQSAGNAIQQSYLAAVAADSRKPRANLFAGMDDFEAAPITNATAFAISDRKHFIRPDHTAGRPRQVSTKLVGRYQQEQLEFKW